MALKTTFRPEQIHPSAFIAPGATIVGDVTIGEDVSIWYNAVIRGDTTAIRIGRGSNIQDGCILHADPGFPCELGEGVTLGHAAIVHGAKLGDNVVIGMRAVVMNGAKIGSNSIVGVGAVVTAGTEVPPGTLVVGLPAKVRRHLTQEEIAGNRLTADHYVRAGHEYRDAHLPKAPISSLPDPGAVETANTVPVPDQENPTIATAALPEAEQVISEPAHEVTEAIAENP